MTSLEDLKPGLKVTGILPDQSVTIVDVKGHGTTPLELFYNHADGQPGTQLLFGGDQSKLYNFKEFRSWKIDSSVNLFSTLPMSTQGGTGS
jgi:hypothetical protein